MFISDTFNCKKTDNVAHKRCLNQWFTKYLGDCLFDFCDNEVMNGRHSYQLTSQGSCLGWLISKQGIEINT